MFVVIFESTAPVEVQDTGAKFYAKLQPIVQTYPGFISEEAFASTSNPEGGVTVAKFEDEAAAQSWRNNSTHLRIQKASREKVFSDYRIRVGNAESTPEAEVGASGTPATGSIVTIIEQPKSSAPALDLDTLRSEGNAEGKIVDAASYDNDEKTVNIIAWALEDAAWDFLKSEQVAHCSLKLCVRVTRDYSKSRREQAPEPSL